MRHEMLTQRAPFCIGTMAKRGTLSQHFVTHVVPPLVQSALPLKTLGPIFTTKYTLSLTTEVVFTQETTTCDRQQ